MYTMHVFKLYQSIFNSYYLLRTYMSKHQSGLLNMAKCILISTKHCTDFKINLLKKGNMHKEGIE